MEAELGVLLFDRTTRKVKLSKFGEVLLTYAKQIVELEDQYTAELQSNREAERETLTVGSIPALAQYNITNAVIRFKKSRPQSTLNILQAGSDELEDMLRKKQCELAFIRHNGDVSDDFVSIPYCIDVLAVVLPAKHPLAKKSEIPLRLLANESFILIQKDTLPYRLSVRACQQNGFEPKIAYTDHRLENLFDLVMKGMGVSLMMKELAVHFANPEIAIVEVSPRTATTLSLCYLKGVELSHAAKYFVRCVEKRSAMLDRPVSPEETYS